MLANDTDPDGSLDPATVNIGSGPANGSLSVHPVTGVVTYTPDANYAGADSFTYTVRDNDGAVSNLARVHLEVTPVNDAPVANDDGSLAIPVSTAEDTALAIDVLANDTDLDGSLDPATVSILSASGPRYAGAQCRDRRGDLYPGRGLHRQRRLQLHGQGRQRGHLEPGPGAAGGDRGQ